MSWSVAPSTELWPLSWTKAASSETWAVATPKPAVRPRQCQGTGKSPEWGGIKIECGIRETRMRVI